MLFQKLGNDSIYGIVPENYEKLDTQALDRLITISNPKEESQS